jgi:hypothetical protein
MAIACAGYRIASVPGHHRLTFEGAKLAVGKPADALADYFDACRRKRNEIDYTGAAIATSTEADEPYPGHQRFQLASGVQPTENRQPRRAPPDRASGPRRN